MLLIVIRETVTFIYQELSIIIREKRRIGGKKGKEKEKEKGKAFSQPSWKIEAQEWTVLKIT